MSILRLGSRNERTQRSSVSHSILFDTSKHLHTVYVEFQLRQGVGPVILGGRGRAAFLGADDVIVTCKQSLDLDPRLLIFFRNHCFITKEDQELVHRSK
eukprot:scaffold22592_cov129-Cylindrotheca_fusiformis.AAC.1